MKSRRQFVMEGTLAATALLATHHLKAFASFVSPLSGTAKAGFGHYNNHLVFLHSSEISHTGNHAALSYMKNVQAEVPNAILINTGTGQPQTSSYDVVAGENNGVVNDSYKIITKGGIATGVVYAAANDDDAIKNADKLATYLKQEKNCQVVVCISQLGHKNKYMPDDITLAAESTNIDVIINGHETNFSPKTMILPNSTRNEVIIQSSKSNPDACAKLEIGFDNDGNKKHVHLATKLYKNIGAA